MTPSVVTGPIAADPEPGSDEWQRDKRAYDREVAKLAKYRRFEAELAAAIPDLELRVRTLALRLGLPSAVGVRRQAPRGETRRRILEALAAGPGPTRIIANRAGVPGSIADTTLRNLRAAGLVAKAARRGGDWRLIDEPAEGA